MSIVTAPAEVVPMSDDDLSAAVGGMSCEKAQTMSKFYVALGDVALNVFGDSAGAAANYGKAQGVLEGGCGR